MEEVDHVLCLNYLQQNSGGRDYISRGRAFTLSYMGKDDFNLKYDIKFMAKVDVILQHL